MSGADERARIVHAANKTGCDCVGFLWRLVKGGDGWRCYRCEPVLPVRNIELPNVRHTRVALLREKLANDPLLKPRARAQRSSASILR